MQALGLRKANSRQHGPDGRAAACAWTTGSRRAGLIGFQGEFMNLTRGTGLISNIFDGYEGRYRGEIAGRKNGVLISQDDGEIGDLRAGQTDDRGRMFVSAGDPALRRHDHRHPQPRQRPRRQRRARQTMTNFRVSGKEDAIKITRRSSSRWKSTRVEFIEDDEARRDHAEVDPPRRLRAPRAVRQSSGLLEPRNSLGPAEQGAPV